MEQGSLLVRRAGPDTVGRLTDLLALRREELDRCAAAGGLFVLADIFWNGSSDPLAALAVSLDRSTRRARVQSIAASGAHAPRLLAGAAMLLGAEGIEAIEADGTAGVERRELLRRAGFEETEGRQLLYWM